jgi:hypothetical protein
MADAEDAGKEYPEVCGVQLFVSSLPPERA